MKVVIQLTEEQERQALPVILRDSPGMILPNRVYVVSDAAARKLRDAHIEFAELSRESNLPSLEGVGVGERV